MCNFPKDLGLPKHIFQSEDTDKTLIECVKIDREQIDMIQGIMDLLIRHKVSNKIRGLFYGGHEFEMRLITNEG